MSTDVRNPLRWWSLPLLGLLLVGGFARAQQPAWLELSDFPRGELTIELADGGELAFRIYLATTPQQQRQGLMQVRELAQDSGMLFLYYPARQVSMWMRNTLIPLDMLFIREDGTIANIIEAAPLTLDQRLSDGKVTGVLELNAGTAERLGIAPGDRVVHSHFAP